MRNKFIDNIQPINYNVRIQYPISNLVEFSSINN